MSASGPYDAIVIGAGHNGLVTAAYLAKGGLRTLVLERSDEPGGCAATDELWPGYRVDTGAHELGALDRRVVRDLRLDRAGLELLATDPTVASLQPGGGALTLYRDPGRTADAIRPFSDRDAGRWPSFLEAMGRAARALGVLYEATPPRVAGADRGDLWEMARLGAKLGRVGRAEAIELMRLLPMTVEELLTEWFESEALKGLLGARGCRGVFQGPLAAGTGFLLLHSLVGRAGDPWASHRVKGGMGRLGETLASVATGMGVEVRTGSAVDRILVSDGEVSGVALASGEEIAAALVASSATPRETFLRLIDPLELDPAFLAQVGNIRYRGAVAKVHFALDAPPRFAAGAASQGAAEAVPDEASTVCVCPDLMYLERAYDDAKYGAPSRAPHLEVSIPTIQDPSLAPEGRHILSILVQYAPCELRGGTWDAAAREALGDTVLRTLEGYAPGLADIVCHRDVMTPADLDRRFGLADGNIYHGEMALDQAFIGRPVPGWARYRTPIAGLYSCGAGAHPGGGLTGTPGANAAREMLAATRT